MKAIIFLAVVTIILSGCTTTLNHDHKINHRSETNHYSENTKDYVPHLSPELEQELLKLAGIDKRAAFAIIFDEDGDSVVIGSSQTKSAEIFASDTLRSARLYSMKPGISIAMIKKSHCYAMGLQSRYYPVRGTTVEICVAS
jgi:hypothetical protein